MLLRHLYDFSFALKELISWHEFLIEYVVKHNNVCNHIADILVASEWLFKSHFDSKQLWCVTSKGHKM
jgi:hypothetical protein